MIHQLHDGVGLMAHVADDRAVPEIFVVTNGAKQGCVLVSTLFSLMFPAMLMDAYPDERPWIRIAYTMDDQLLNRRRMRFQSQVSTATVHELPFAGDCALNTTTEEDIQRSMDPFASGCVYFGLTVNAGKTLVMHQLPPNAEQCPSHPRQRHRTEGREQIRLPKQHNVALHQN
ncbi:hypothetical protein SprV_0100355400 [Sparganum proliferum]